VQKIIKNCYQKLLDYKIKCVLIELTNRDGGVARVCEPRAASEFAVQASTK